MEISGHRQAVRSGGEEMIKRLAVEGIVGGTIGATVMATWFLMYDLAHGQPLQTPALLGAVLFQGLREVVALRITTTRRERLERDGEGDAPPRRRLRARGPRLLLPWAARDQGAGPLGLAQQGESARES